MRNKLRCIQKVSNDLHTNKTTKIMMPNSRKSKVAVWSLDLPVTTRLIILLANEVATGKIKRLNK